MFKNLNNSNILGKRSRGDSFPIGESESKIAHLEIKSISFDDHVHALSKLTDITDIKSYLDRNHFLKGSIFERHKTGVRLFVHSVLKRDISEAEKVHILFNNDCCNFFCSEGYFPNFEDLELKGNGPRFILIMAMELKDDLIFDFFINHGADLNTNLPAEDSLLVHAITLQRPEYAIQLLKNGANPLVVNQAGDTPFHLAARAGNLSLIEAFVSRGFDVNTQITLLAQNILTRSSNISHNEDVLGFTPLHFACLSGNLETIKALLENGAIIDGLIPNEITPLQCLLNLNLHSSFSSSSIVDRIINKEEFQLKTLEAIEYLLEQGANPNGANQPHSNSLHIVLEQIRFNAMMIDCESRNPANIKHTGTPFDQVPGHKRTKHFQEKILKLLLKFNANILMPLKTSCLQNDTEMVKIILEHMTINELDEAAKTIAQLKAEGSMRDLLINAYCVFENEIENYAEFISSIQGEELFDTMHISADISDFLLPMEGRTTIHNLKTVISDLPDGSMLEKEVTLDIGRFMFNYDETRLGQSFEIHADFPGTFE